MNVGSVTAKLPFPRPFSIALVLLGFMVGDRRALSRRHVTEPNFFTQPKLFSRQDKGHMLSRATFQKGAGCVLPEDRDQA